MATSTSTSTSTTSSRAVTLPIAALVAMLSVSAASDDVSGLKLSVRAPKLEMGVADRIAELRRRSQAPEPLPQPRRLSAEEVRQIAYWKAKRVEDIAEAQAFWEATLEARRNWKSSNAQGEPQPEGSPTQSPQSSSPASSRAASSPSSPAVSSRSASPTLRLDAVDVEPAVAEGSDAERWWNSPAAVAERESILRPGTGISIRKLNRNLGALAADAAAAAPQPQAPTIDIDGPLITPGANQDTLITIGKEAEVEAALSAAREEKRAAATAVAVKQRIESRVTKAMKAKVSAAMPTYIKEKITEARDKRLGKIGKSNQSAKITIGI